MLAIARWTPWCWPIVTGHRSTGRSLGSVATSYLLACYRSFIRLKSSPLCNSCRLCHSISSVRPWPSQALPVEKIKASKLNLLPLLFSWLSEETRKETHKEKKRGYSRGRTYRGEWKLSRPWTRNYHISYNDNKAACFILCVLSAVISDY